MTTATKRSARRSSAASSRASRRVEVCESPRVFAVGTIELGRLVAIVDRNLTLGEAAAFVNAYDRFGGDRCAVIATEASLETIAKRAASNRAPRARVAKVGA